MHPAYVIRPGAASDLDQLPDIERAASTLFVTVGGWEQDDVPQYVLSVEQHRAYLDADRLWVAVTKADDQPIGFAVASIVDGHGHLDEIDVHPDHGRRGIGRALVERVIVWARESDLPAVTLTTERDIPWNAPFYARLGFAILADDALTEGLRAILAAEVAHGLNPATRVAMRYTIQNAAADSQSNSNEQP
ncbi:MAG: GNAT family N-acetyltransferase [Anaerolineae bacterium]|nr:GNAT family N-acetyltransferase [Anaerolineae bacterium]